MQAFGTECVCLARITLAAVVADPIRRRTEEAFRAVGVLPARMAVTCGHRALGRSETFVTRERFQTLAEHLSEGAALLPFGKGGDAVELLRHLGTDGRFYARPVGAAGVPFGTIVALVEARVFYTVNVEEISLSPPVQDTFELDIDIPDLGGNN